MYREGTHHSAGEVESGDPARERSAGDPNDPNIWDAGLRVSLHSLHR